VTVSSDPSEAPVALSSEPSIAIEPAPRQVTEAQAAPEVEQDFRETQSTSEE
jgi:hypothetical protein